MCAIFFIILLCYYLKKYERFMKVRGDVIVHLSSDLKDHVKVNVSLLLLWLLLMVKMRITIMLKMTQMTTMMMKIMIQKDDQFANKW